MNQLTVVDQNGEIVNVAQDEGLAMPLPALVERMNMYQEVCKALLTPDDYQGIGGKAFKKKSAYRKLALAFGITITIIEKDVVYVDGRIHHAEFTVRATAKNGRYIDGWGGASIEDRDFSHDQDVAATAQTRATSRAIADVLGTGEVSAEEMTDKPNRPRSTPTKAQLVAEADTRHHPIEDTPEDLGTCPDGHRYREGKFGIQCSHLPDIEKYPPKGYHNHKKPIDTSRYSTAPATGKSQPQSTAPRIRDAGDLLAAGARSDAQSSREAAEGRQRIDGMIVGVGGTPQEPTITVEKQGKRLTFRVSPDVDPVTVDHLEWDMEGIVVKDDRGYVVVEVSHLAPKQQPRMTAPTAERIREIRAHAVILREHLPDDNLAANDTHDLLAALDYVAGIARDVGPWSLTPEGALAEIIDYIEGGKP